MLEKDALTARVDDVESVITADRYGFCLDSSVLRVLDKLLPVPLALPFIDRTPLLLLPLPDQHLLRFVTALLDSLLDKGLVAHGPFRSFDAA